MKLDPSPSVLPGRFFLRLLKRKREREREREREKQIERQREGERERDVTRMLCIYRKNSYLDQLT